MPDVEGRETLAKLWAVIFDRTEPIHAGGFVNQGDEQTAVALQGLELHRIANALEDIAARLAKPKSAPDLYTDAKANRDALEAVLSLGILDPAMEDLVRGRIQYTDATLTKVRGGDR